MITKLSSDTAFAVFGCGLAAASASFGVYMTMHGPSSGLGTSQDFTVFAQLAPRPTETSMKPHIPLNNTKDLDLTATASIPKAASSSRPPAIEHGDIDAQTAGTVVPGITLQAAGDDAAEVAVDGRLQRVRVGDLIPGAGQVLAIYPGRHPMLKTSRGLVVSTTSP